MLESLFQNTTYMHLKAALDVSAARQAAIAENIANADTPGYHRKIVSFSDALFAAGEKRGATDVTAGGVGSANALLASTSSAIRIIDDPNATADENGNTVDLFREMSEQSVNQLQFDTLAQLISDRLTTIRKVISGSTTG